SCCFCAFVLLLSVSFFFFQAEDGIRDLYVTGVQTCALPIFGPVPASRKALEKAGWTIADLDLIEANEAFAAQALSVGKELGWDRSEERRVGKECRWRWSAGQ